MTSPRQKVEREITLFNEQLEGKVAERTRSLSDANDQLGKAYDDLKQAQQTLVESEKMASLGSPGWPAWPTRSTPHRA